MVRERGQLRLGSGRSAISPGGFQTSQSVLNGISYNSNSPCSPPEFSGLEFIPIQSGLRSNIRLGDIHVRIIWT